MPIRGRFDPVAWAADPHRTRTGDILVTAVTNVGRTPLFPRQAAIVTAALEPGIPAAVSCGNLTALLHWRRSALTADTARCRSTTTPTHHAASSDRAGTGPAAGARRNDFAAQSPDPAAMSVATGRTQASTSCSLACRRDRTAVRERPGHARGPVPATHRTAAIRVHRLDRRSRCVRLGAPCRV
jgi:hypothetical protein